jgi:hypothetical protein
MPMVTLEESVRAEIEAARENGDLGDGLRTEPRCHVCCEVESKELVNRLLCAGLTNREVTESCRYINIRRTDAGDDRIISARSVWHHRRFHFGIDEPAKSVYREIMERRADEDNVDHVNGIGHAITPYAVMETVMVKGYHNVVQDDTVITVKETVDAAARLYDLTNQDTGQRKMADVLYAMDRIIRAAQEFIPESDQEAFLARVDGRPTPEPMAALVEHAQQAVKEFTPPTRVDVEDEL